MEKILKALGFTLAALLVLALTLTNTALVAKRSSGSASESKRGSEIKIASGTRFFEK